MRRILLLAAAVVIPVSGFTLATGSTAWAGKFQKIQCTSLNGQLASLTISGCTGGNTGGGANNVSGSVLAGGGVVTWISGGTITFGPPASGATSAKKCPGYVKNAASNPVADKFTLPVTADSGDGVKLPGKAKGAVCINNVSGNVTLLKTLKIT